jgi:protein-S-isoprenylcysteine O-methyltransferase Ste14
MLTRLTLGILISLVATPALADGKYSADRYDSRIEALRGGAIQVTETVVIRFESGSFTQFFRAIPVRMTDGIEVVSASMDDQPLARGKGAGQFEISNSSNVRVTWHFPQTPPSTHTFDLVYTVRGVVRQEADADVLAWRILPSEHRYQIASSTADISLPSSPIVAPELETRRVGDSSVRVNDRSVRIDARDLRANGWTQTSIRLPRGSVIDEPPAWQQHQIEVAETARTWIIAGVIVVVGGLILLFFVHQQYDSPTRDYSTAAHWAMPPDASPPAIAGALLANGSPRLEHAMAALVSLAERGELRIDEQRRLLGQRQFTITRAKRDRSMAPYEEKLIEIIFDGHGGTVALGKARNRLMRQFRKFKTALEPAMQAAGLLDEDRRAVRRRFAQIAIACLISAGVAAFTLALMVERFGPLPMLIPAALAVVGAATLICFAAHTPLSNEGIQRARGWRGFRGHLRDIARDREPSPSDPVTRQMLSYAIALGLAHSWASYLKKHRSAAPDWFHAVAATGDDSAVAFSTFVASGGAHAGGAHGGAAGATAGGGASGAS